MPIETKPNDQGGKTLTITAPEPDGHVFTVEPNTLHLFQQSVGTCNTKDGRRVTITTSGKNIIFAIKDGSLTTTHAYDIGQLIGPLLAAHDEAKAAHGPLYGRADGPFGPRKVSA